MASPATPPLEPPDRSPAAGWAPFGVALVAALSGALGAYALQYEPARAAVGGAAPLTMSPSATEPAPGLPAWLHIPGSDEPVLTLAELRELKASLINAPDPTGEFTRVAERLLFVDATQRFQQLRTQGGDAQELHELALLIDDALDTQLRRGEVALADAHVLKQLVLEVREPDPARRQAAFVRWATANATPP